MTKTSKTLTAAFVATACGLAARPCLASGFLIYEVSGEGIGRASAVSADATEPAAVWYNPANLVYMDGVSASATGMLVTSKATFSAAGGGAETSSERGNTFIPALFASARLSDRVAVGFGGFSTFGISIRWPSDWVGREAAIHAKLETLAFNPTVAVKLHQQVSVAAGFSAVRGVVDLTSGLPTLIGGDVRLAAGTWGYGFNVASLYKILPERLHVALTYRSRVQLDFNGRANFNPANPDFLPVLPDQPGSASITLPEIITVGFMGRPRSDLALTFDVNVVLWSRFNRIDIDFQAAPDRAIVPNGRDTFTLRGGVDWAVPARWPGLHLRGGLIYDRSAIPSTNLAPSLPDANRVDVALGAGYSRGCFRGDLGYLLVYFLPADSITGQEGPVGTYDSVAHLFGLTLGVSWR
jgi:long-chain fatty acid transport protein